MMRAFTVLLLLTTTLYSLGCSGPPLKRGQTLGEFNIPDKIANDERQIAVYVEEFTIAKSVADPHVIGDARVGAFNVPAEVRSEEPIQVYIAGELRRAFLTAGLRIETKDNTDFVVTGQVERVWVEENIGGLTESVRASVRYDIILKNKEGKFVWGKSIESMEISQRSLDATKYDIPTLIKALKNSIESIFRDASFWKAIRNRF